MSFEIIQDIFRFISFVDFNDYHFLWGHLDVNLEFEVVVIRVFISFIFESMLWLYYIVWDRFCLLKVFLVAAVSRYDNFWSIDLLLLSNLLHLLSREKLYRQLIVLVDRPRSWRNRSRFILWKLYSILTLRFLVGVASLLIRALLKKRHFRLGAFIILSDLWFFATFVCKKVALGLYFS